ncbi:SAM-dependent methyltransferase [Paenibacillus sp. TRM 82003]|nr:SAM-dependent methyltransferase [Paenibacillus sp. TRM 82003]
MAVVEWGGGDGRLAEAVLDELSNAYPADYARLRWYAAESSPHHRELQRSRLSQRHAERIEAIAPPSDPRIDAALRSDGCLVFANELLDAFPVHRFRYAQGQWREIFVSYDEAQEAFAETERPVSNPVLEAFVQGRGLRPANGQTVEIGQSAMEWIEALGCRLKRGAVLLVDYGDVTAELWAPHRMNGTLLAYRNHQAHEDVYRFVGEQDLTAHVNFEWCREAAERSGFRNVDIRSQKQFLIDQGVLEMLQSHDGRDPFSAAARANRAIRQLLLSDGMSELFKVMTMEKRPI